MVKKLSLMLAFLMLFAVTPVMAQPIDYCEGNFDNDNDQDGTDAFVFKQDFGRSSLLDPCPVIQCQTAEQLEMRIAQLESLLANVTRNGNDITFSGVNVHIVDGSGDTYGAVNGLGNLVVGYNELRYDGTDDRSGSHNIVVGRFNNYSSYGGLLAGEFNAISGPHASVSGGIFNVASSDFASVSGGHDNRASAAFASVSGGQWNTASGEAASVSGGASNVAVGQYASVSGGHDNTASGQYASVSGGEHNTASANSASVSGGFINTASGGFINTASGGWSSISGGNSQSVTGFDDWRGGSCFFCEN